MKIVTAEEMRRIDQDCAGVGLAVNVLMENAGKAVAEEVSRILSNIDKQQVLILIGPGNNGGDGLVAARYLHDSGASISIYLCSERANDPNLELVRERGITCVTATGDANLGKFDRLISSANCVIDALLGTGKMRPLQGVFQQVLERVGNYKRNNEGLRIIAVDLPSGLDADSGAIDPACLKANNTITLGLPKLGLYNFPGAERAGAVSIADIGIPEHLTEKINTELVTAEWARTVVPERPLNANKGSFGHVLVAAGSINYTGAAYLACSGAIRVGAGLVTLATATSLLPILASKLTEVIYLSLPESLPGIVSLQAADLIAQQFNECNVLLLGCGLGQSQPAMKFVSSVLLKAGHPALVLDADALNTLAKIPNWWQELTNDAILTPHPGEMARLCGLTVAEVQADRISITKEKAMEWHKTIVLKGAFTVIAAPDDRCRISPVANPGLASAGTGDVLSGAIAGLVAQGVPLYDAAALGVHLHGEAGETVKNTLGNAGMTATDLLPALPMAIKQLK
ncbi:NAD(P)H-hydrate dehydratase [Chloroflexota bacterium]